MKPTCGYEGCGQPEEHANHQEAGFHMRINPHPYQPRVEAAKERHDQSKRAFCCIECLKNNNPACSNPYHFDPAPSSPVQGAGELKPDNLFGVYCSGNPESLPTNGHFIYWEGWQRVADFVNRKRVQGAAPGPDLLQWLTDRVNDGMGAIELCTTEDGEFGVFRNDGKKAWATGNDAKDAIYRAAQKYPNGKDYDAATPETVPSAQKADELLQQIADTVARYPTVTGLQEACQKDHSLIRIAIIDMMDTYKDIIKRTKRDYTQIVPSAQNVDKQFEGMAHDESYQSESLKLAGEGASLDGSLSDRLVATPSLVSATEGVGEPMKSEVLIFPIARRLMTDMREAIDGGDVPRITEIYYQMWPNSRPEGTSDQQETAHQSPAPSQSKSENSQSESNPEPPTPTPKWEQDSSEALALDPAPEFKLKQGDPTERPEIDTNTQSLCTEESPITSRLKEIAERESKAAPGPWLVGSSPDEVVSPCQCCGLIATCEVFGPPGTKDPDCYHTTFIAHARTDIPWLLKLVEDRDLACEHANEIVGRLESELAEANKIASNGLDEIRRLVSELVSAREINGMLISDNQELTARAISAEAAMARKEPEWPSLMEGSSELGDLVAHGRWMFNKAIEKCKAAWASGDMEG